MQKMIYIVSIMMVGLGISLGVSTALHKIQEGAYLLIAPMIMIGVWLFAYNITRRSNGNTR
jgi:ABC-type multidrug transport system permease subunit